MQRLLAIAFLTFKATYRFRLIPVLSLLLLGTVVALPMIIKDDGTARGFTQILMTYTLTVTTAVLGFASLWLACGILAREVEEGQMQTVAVKPVARWQIWLGKWLGIMMLNGLLLGLAGAAVYGLMQWRARQLPPAQQQVLRNEVLVARASVKEQRRNLEPLVEQEFKRRTSQTVMSELDRKVIRDQIREQIKAGVQIVRPGFARRWVIELGPRRHFLKDQPLYIRTKFTTAQKSVSDLSAPRTYPTFWEVGVPETAKYWQSQMNLAADSFHEFAISPNLFDDQGRLTIDCANPGEVDLLFLLEDGMEVLYREGGFGLNFIRGLGIIFFWLALLAAVGLAAASFLSFPVAAFLSLGILIVGLSSGTLSQVIQEGGISGVNHDTGFIEKQYWIDKIVVAVFSGLLKIVNLVQGFSPVDSLSTGRSITWWQLGQALTQIVLLLGGIFGGLGMILFTRRELATAQGNQ